MGTLANSEDPDEMPITFAKTKSIFMERNIYFFEIIILNSSIYTMDHPELTVSNFIESSIGPKRVKMYFTLAP